MVEVGLSEAEAALGAYVDAALRGEDVVITQAGKQLVKLTPVTGAGDPRTNYEGDALAKRISDFAQRLAAEAPNPEAADIDADLHAMRRRD